MYCSKCGNQIPDGAKFCGICGNQVAPIITRDEKEDNAFWEICQIQTLTNWTNLATSQVCECYFWGDAIGINGPYCAAQTEKYKLEQKWKWEPPANPPMGGKEKDQKKVLELLGGLIKTLQADGWQILPERGTYAWQYKFKRKAR
jgi:hypothetical protein